MNALSKTKIFSLVIAFLMLGVSSCGANNPQPTALSIPVPSTETPVPSLPPTISSTPTSSFTPSPRPTITPTPLPGWVTDFAQPILAALADRSPGFQDDFGPGSAGWQKNYCEGSMKYIDGELAITKCRVFHPNTDWRDLVLEVDMRFLKDTSPSTEWALHFRDLGNSGHVLSLYHNGTLAISFTKAQGDSDRLEFRNPGLSNDQVHHILLIARGNRFAFYLDGQPLYYAENDEYLFGRSVFYAEGGAAAMDNLKIWDISTIPVP